MFYIRAATLDTFYHVVAVGSSPTTPNIVLQTIDPVTCTVLTRVEFGSNGMGEDTAMNLATSADNRAIVVTSATTSRSFFDGTPIPLGVTPYSTVGVVTLLNATSGVRYWSSFIVQLGVGSDTVVSAWANGVVIDPYDNILVSGSIAVGMDQSGTYAFLSRYQFYPNESTNSTLLWRVPIDTLYRLQADIVTMLHPTQPTVGYVVGRMTDDNSPRLSYTFVARFSTTDLTGAQCEVLGTLMGTGDGHSDDPVDAVMLNGYIYVFVNSDGYTPLQFNRGVFFNQLPYTPYTVYFRGRWDLGLLKIDVTSRPHHASVVDMSLYGGFSGDLAFALSMFSGDGANSNPLAVMIGGTSLPWVDDASCAITSNIRPIILTNDRCVLFRAGEYCYNASTNGCAFRECQYAAPCPAGYTCPGNGVAFENCPSNATALVCAPPFAVYMLDPTATITCNCPFSPPPEPDPQQSSGKSWVAYVVIFSVAAFVIGCVAGVCVYLLWGSQHRVIRYGAMLDSSAQTPQAASVTLQA